MGDLEVLAAAFFYAINTIRLGVHAKKMSALELSTRVMIVSSACTFGWAGYDYATATLGGRIFILPLLCKIQGFLVPSSFSSSR